MPSGDRGLRIGHARCPPAISRREQSPWLRSYLDRREGPHRCLERCDPLGDLAIKRGIGYEAPGATTGSSLLRLSIGRGNNDGASVAAGTSGEEKQRSEVTH